MKLLQFILFVWIFVIIESKNLDKKLLFEGCDHDGWKVKNISIAPTGDKINITANIMNSTDEKTNSSYLVKLTLMGCNKNFTCSNVTNLTDGSLNCTAANHTEWENEKCEVIKIIENWTRESSNVKVSRENKNPRDGCILYEALTSKPQTTQKPDQKTNETTGGSMWDPLLKRVAINPSVIF